MGFTLRWEKADSSLFTYSFSLWMWWLTANVAYNARQSACVESWCLIGWNYIQ